MNNEFLALIRNKMEKDKMSIREVCRRAGLSPTHMSFVLKGERELTFPVVAKVSKVFGINPVQAIFIAGLLPVSLPMEDQPRAE